MLKLIELDLDTFRGEDSVKVLDLTPRTGSGLEKKAADSRIDAFVADLKPEPGKIYLHILAMGAGEYYGANRNADFFPEENLKKYHHTFVTSPAHIFKHHINKNPEIAIGRVVFSFYNERMHRVEIIAWVDKEKGRDYVSRIEGGEFPAMSMACHTPFDTCSICNNKARSRNEYCSHLRTELGRIHADGRKVMAINDGALRFFDQSFVFKPADVTSSVLQKVAYFKGELGPVLGSAENAELNSLTEKKAEIRKVSELIKYFEGDIAGSSESLSHVLSKVKDPDDSVLKTLVHFDLHHVIHALADLGISPSVGFFVKLIGNKISGQRVDEVTSLVNAMLKEDADKVEVPSPDLTKVAEAYPTSLRFTLGAFVKQSSLFPQEVMGRAMIQTPGYSMSELSDTHNVGYIGNGPHVAPDPRQTYAALKASMKPEEQGLLKTLFMIGGVAIAAKWLLSHMINSKMEEHRLKNQQTPVKIVLVKSAEEAYTTQQLVKASLLKGLNAE